MKSLKEKGRRLRVEGAFLPQPRLFVLREALFLPDSNSKVENLS
jgi:hypothetical protein